MNKPTKLLNYCKKTTTKTMLTLFLKVIFASSLWVYFIITFQPQDFVSIACCVFCAFIVLIGWINAFLYTYLTFKNRK